MNEVIETQKTLRRRLTTQQKMAMSRPAMRLVLLLQKSQESITLVSVAC